MTPEELARTINLYTAAYGLARNAGYMTTLAGIFSTLLLWSEAPYSSSPWPPWPFMLTLSCICFCVALMRFIGMQLDRLLK